MSTSGEATAESLQHFLYVGTWRGQVGGRQIVRDIRDMLDEEGYSLTQFEGGPVRWTTRGVEMVLFMDDY